MKIYRPEEIRSKKDLELKENTIIEHVNRVIIEFNHAVLTDNFQDITSTENYKDVFYPVNQSYCKKEVFEEAVKLLRENGWDVKYTPLSCARGWFHAIRIYNKY